MNAPTPADETAAQVEQGQTLVQRVAQVKGGTGLPLSQVTQIVSDVAVALDQLHARGHSHGAVDASQIVVPTHGPARLSETADAGSSTGSAGEDVAGLVSAAYYALCGVPPSFFRAMSSVSGAASPDASASVPVSPNLHRPELSADVGGVFTRGLSPRPQDRFASAGAFAAALRQAAGPTSGLPTALLPAKRILVSAVAAVAVVALAFGLWLGHLRTPQPPISVATAPVTAPVSPPDVPSLSKQPPAVAEAVPHPPTTAHRPGLQTAEEPAVLDAKPVPSAAPITDTSPLVPNAAGKPSLNADRAVPPRRPAVPLKSAAAGRSYMRVYARQFVSMSDVITHRLRPVRARRVLVDGNPSQALSVGHWASVSPGRHKLAFYPSPGIPFDPNMAFWVQVRPHRHSAFLIPLPRHPGGIQSPALRKSPPGPV